MQTQRPPSQTFPPPTPRENRRDRASDEASRLLASIVESTDDAIIGIDLTGNIKTWNNGAARLYGYKPEEVIGKSVLELLPADRRDEEPAIIARILRGERVENYETARRHRDGRIIDISLTVSAIRDEEGRVVGASKIGRDITLRKRTEAQQQALYELVTAVNQAKALSEIYEAAMTAMLQSQAADRAAILLFDADGVMRFEAFRGLSAEYRKVVEGHSPWRPGERNPVPIWIDEVANATLPPALKGAVVREGIGSLAFVPLTFEERLLGKFMIYHNRPHRFSAEELHPVSTIASQVAFALERRRYATALEDLVAARTASLQEAIAQMEEFSYSVSHDLRSPTRAMRGYAEAILEDYGPRLDDTGKELLRRIMRSGTRMDRLIQDLLTYSRLTRRDPVQERVHTDRLVRELIQQYPEMQPARSEIRIEGVLPDVLGHEPSLTQVFSNLIGNAVKFVAPGARPRIVIRGRSEGGRVRIEVADSGIGIDPALHGRLFAMFERLHPTQAYEGTGIGLAIVRKAVERMNGEVGVASDGRTGSTFWFVLPAADTPVNREP